MFKYFLIPILLLPLIYFYYHSSKIENQKFSITLPKNWEILKDQNETDLIALAPASEPDDLFRENLSVLSTKLDIPLKSSEFYDLNLATLEALLDDFDLEQQDDVEINGFKARRLIYTHRVGPVNLRVIQYLFLEHQTAWIVTFTSDTIEYNHVKGVFDQVSKTFAIIDN